MAISRDEYTAFSPSPEGVDGLGSSAGIERIKQMPEENLLNVRMFLAYRDLNAELALWL